MKCAEVRENLAAWLDGEIAGAPRRAMDEHYASCSACDGERRAQAAVWALLDRYGTPVPDDDGGSFRERVMARVREVPASRDGGAPVGRLLRLPLPLGAAAAAAALLAAAAGGLYLGGVLGPGAGGSSPGRTGPAAVPGIIEVSRQSPEPPAGLLDNMAVLESLDLLQDDDLRLLDRLSGYDDEDLAPFGG